MFGWRGQLLRVNLTSGAIKKEPLEENAVQTYLGGRGLGAYLHAKEVPASTEPLSAANHLVFITGPLTGTLAPNGGRYTLVAKALPDGAITAASIGGSWGPELKYAGFDAIIFEGQAPEPVYLWITDGASDLRSAAHLQGKTVAETTVLLRRETDDKAKVSCIGPAGENGVSFAVVVSDYSSAAGGTGLGAVMAGKNLKGVAVRGTQGFRVANPGRFLRAAMDIRATMAAKPMTGKGTRLYDFILVADRVEEDSSPPEGGLARPHGCFGCATGFSSFVVDGEGKEALRLTGDAPPGSIDARLQQYGLFTDLGLEFVAMKTMLGTLSKGDGGDEAKLARKTAYGNGSRGCFARHLNASPAKTIDGDYPPTDRSGCVAGGYMVIPRIAGIASSDSPASAHRLRLLAAVADSAGLCPFILGNVEVEAVAELLSAVTGIDYSPGEIMRAGERITEPSWRAG
jgi:aldehyde:ferredoxin oxidoreductase